MRRRAKETSALLWCRRIHRPGGRAGR